MRGGVAELFLVEDALGTELTQGTADDAIRASEPPGV